MPTVMTQSGPCLSSWHQAYNGGRRYELFVAQLHTTEAMVGMFIMAGAMECRTDNDLPWSHAQRPPEEVDVRIP